MWYDYENDIYMDDAEWMDFLENEKKNNPLLGRLDRERSKHR